MKSIFVFIISILILELHSSFAQESYDVNILKANMEFLASDALMGRESGTFYEELSAQFIASELKKYGVKAFGDEGSYFQSFEVLKNSMSINSTIKLMAGDGIVSTTLEPIKDFVGEIVNLNEDILASPLEMVFCGYGITDEVSGYDDYMGLDLKGKIAVVTFGIPSEKYHDNLTGVNLGRFRSPALKVQVAATAGAEAVFFVPDELLEQMWGMLAQMTTEDKFTLAGYPPEDSFFPLPALGLKMERGNEFFLEEEITFEKIKSLSGEGQKLDKFLMRKKIILDFDMVKTRGFCKNVVGLIEGLNKDEVITIGAHYDHIGKVDSEIFNGADDNASGTVAILEAARNLVSGEQLKRNVAVIFYGAEEKGLLGSRFFAGEWRDKENLIVNINIDMCGRGKVDTITVRGPLETSGELFEIVKSIDNESSMDFDLKKGLTDGMGSSDHASFAAVGIPVIDLCDDMESDLHMPTDDYDKIDYDKIGKTSTVVEKIVRKISELDHKLSRETE
ncbi:MAG: M20/M25/M40 family metallo-hydrolase [Bacteroidetes bacterium]|nr:M20/M25/M40 family metallo-hydrolase [Bacteroidota bacterium]